MKEISFKGTLEAVYFQNDSNYYKVLLINVDESDDDRIDDQIVVTGTFGQMHHDTQYTFVGHIVEHQKYGVQFKVTAYQQEEITSVKGLIYYFSSDRFSGIGTVLATRIVDTLGTKAIELISEQSELLKTIPGLTPKKRLMLIEQVQLDRGENQTLLDLLKFGFNDKEAFKIYQFYKDKAKVVIDHNPYQLLETIEGLSFSKIDQLAEKLDFDANAIERLQGALYFVVKELSYRQGHTYFTPKTVLVYAIQLLEEARKEMINEQLLAQALAICGQSGVLIQDGERVALPSLYYAEQSIASRIKAIAKQEKYSYPEKDVDDAIQSVQKQLGVVYAPEQIAAIKQAIQSPISVLTGGPGTGKTTVLKGVVACFALLNDIPLHQSSKDKQTILLAAPTGRAAKRMSELIGLHATTLHRLLGIGLTGQDVSGVENEINELEGAFLVIDEMSMVDTWLMNWVVKAIPMGMSVLLVGDKDQLPSVGPGKVLKDILESHSVPVTQLVQVFRQNETSTIIPLAHSINHGELPVDFIQQKADRSYFECLPQQVQTVVQKVVVRALEKGYSIHDIQVLAPMYKGPAGIDALNVLIQSIANPPTPKKREINYFNKIFRVGDKVLQQVNVPEKSIFNGDMGKIVSILKTENGDEIVVQYDDNEVSYTANEFNQITLAYCCSIHKAQGSEFPLVILPMVKGYSRMLRRNLLYTAVTRSKQSIVFCGEFSAFQLATEQTGEERLTLLLERLSSNPVPVSNDNQPKTNKVSEASETDYRLYENMMLTIDAMIGMDGITPYQFMQEV
ncbi:ATP-dependent RecD-like DNA helicase [Carnobacteriaceae bacterium zg-ZUI252]|nr:ATP-dependent RecD-like DNA helicase [Carnobacteriaceae bacterium zg-ZUI252]